MTTIASIIIFLFSIILVALYYETQLAGKQAVIDDLRRDVKRLEFTLGTPIHRNN